VLLLRSMKGATRHLWRKGRGRISVWHNFYGVGLGLACGTVVGWRLERCVSLGSNVLQLQKQFSSTD